MTRSWLHEVDNNMDVKLSNYQSHNFVPWKYIFATDQSNFGWVWGGVTSTAQKVKLSKTESETPPRHHERLG